MDKSDLKQVLEELFKSYHIDYLSTDPLEIVRRYIHPEDQEITAFIASSLALGHSNLIKRAVGDLLDRMGPSPYRFVLNFDPLHVKKHFDGFVYRFYRDRDIGLLIWWLHQVIHEAGSIKSFFLICQNKPDPQKCQSCPLFRFCQYPG